MKYSILAKSESKNDASVVIKETEITFGTTPDSESILPNPAELFLGSLAACMLKSVERFSEFMKFDFSHAEIIIDASRSDKPPKMEAIEYQLIVYSADQSLNVDLLKKNVEKFGTIFNTVKMSCEIEGSVKISPLI